MPSRSVLASPREFCRSCDHDGSFPTRLFAFEHPPVLRPCARSKALGSFEILILCRESGELVSSSLPDLSKGRGRCMMLELNIWEASRSRLPCTHFWP